MTEKFRSIVIHAVKSVIEQGAPSLSDSGGYCAYRGRNGTKCAIGHLIDDSAYHAHLESKTISTEQIRKAVSQSQEYPLSVAEATILGNIQSAHDNAAFKSEYDFVTAFKVRVLEWVPPEVRVWLIPVVYGVGSEGQS